MATDTSDVRQANSTSSAQPGSPRGPQSQPGSDSANNGSDGDGTTGINGVKPKSGSLATRSSIAVLGVLHVAFGLILLYLLFKAWPPQPWPTETVNGDRRNISDTITFFLWLRGGIKVYTSLDERLFFLVIVAGGLGSFIHAATSFADYVGNRKLTTSWAWWYVLRPFIGITLALICYFVARAGFMTGGAGDVNPYGIASLAALAGMFSKQATDKLEEIFGTIFRPAPGKGDAKRGDKLGAPTISGINPDRGPVSGGTEVSISGTGFVDKPGVTFDGVPAIAVTFSNATTIKAVTPAHEAGDVDVVISNPDGQEGSPKKRFTYSEQSETAETKPAGGEEATAAATDPQEEENTLDGCDVEVKDPAGDEDLPVTEGGVA
jgi:hypothetical protein